MVNDTSDVVPNGDYRVAVVIPPMRSLTKLERRLKLARDAFDKEYGNLAARPSSILREAGLDKRGAKHGTSSSSSPFLTLSLLPTSTSQWNADKTVLYAPVGPGGLTPSQFPSQLRQGLINYFTPTRKETLIQQGEKILQRIGALDEEQQFEANEYLSNLRSVLNKHKFGKSDVEGQQSQGEAKPRSPRQHPSAPGMSPGSPTHFQPSSNLTVHVRRLAEMLQTTPVVIWSLLDLEMESDSDSLSTSSSHSSADSVIVNEMFESNSPDAREPVDDETREGSMTRAKRVSGGLQDHQRESAAHHHRHHHHHHHHDGDSQQQPAVYSMLGRRGCTGESKLQPPLTERPKIEMKGKTLDRGEKKMLQYKYKRAEEIMEIQKKKKELAVRAANKLHYPNLEVIEEVKEVQAGLAPSWWHESQFSSPSSSMRRRNNSFGPNIPDLTVGFSDRGVVIPPLQPDGPQADLGLSSSKLDKSGSVSPSKVQSGRDSPLRASRSQVAFKEADLEDIIGSRDDRNVDSSAGDGNIHNGDLASISGDGMQGYHAKTKEGQEEEVAGGEARDQSIEEAGVGGSSTLGSEKPANKDSLLQKPYSARWIRSPSRQPSQQRSRQALGTEDEAIHLSRPYSQLNGELWDPLAKGAVRPNSGRDYKAGTRPYNLADQLSAEVSRQKGGPGLDVENPEPFEPLSSLSAPGHQPTGHTMKIGLAADRFYPHSNYRSPEHLSRTTWKGGPAGVMANQDPQQALEKHHQHKQRQHKQWQHPLDPVGSPFGSPGKTVMHNRAVFPGSPPTQCANAPKVSKMLSGFRDSLKSPDLVDGAAGALGFLRMSTLDGGKQADRQGVLLGVSGEVTVKIQSQLNEIRQVHNRISSMERDLLPLEMRKKKKDGILGELY